MLKEKGVKSMLYGIARITLMVFLFFLIENSFAQKGMYVRIYGMPQRTFMYDDPNANDEAEKELSLYRPDVNFGIWKKPSYNFAVGFLLEYYLNKKLSIVYGLQYSPHHQKFMTYHYAYGIEIKGNTRLKYLKLPVLIEYDYLITKNSRLFISGGPQLSILISALGSFPLYTNSTVISLYDEIDPGTVFNEITLDGVLTTGIERKIYKNTSIFLQTRFDCSLTNVQDKSFEMVGGEVSAKLYEYPNVTLVSKHNISLGISAGLSFKIK